MALDNVMPLREAPSPTRPKRSGVSTGVQLREQFLKLKRRKWAILATVLFVTLAAIVTVEQIEPEFQAQADVMLEARRQQTLNIESVLSDLPVDVDTIQSEIAVITSRRLAEKVIDRLGLDTMAEFNPRLAALDDQNRFDPMAWIKGRVDGALSLVGLRSNDPPVADDTVREDENRTKVINAVLNRLSVSPRGRSRVIRIGFTSVDPQRAALIANTYAELYILEQLDATFEATQRASQWLNQRLADLRTQTETAERRAEEYRQTAGLLQGDGASTLAQEAISRLNAELISARSDLTTAEARLRQAEPALGAGPVGLPSAVLDNPLVQRLQEQVITLQRRQAELTGVYGPRHPTILNARAELSEAQNRLGGEIGKVVSSLRNDVQVARTRVESLSRDLGRLESQAGELGQREVALRSLEAEAESNRALLTQLTQRFNETTLQQDLQQPEARVLSTAPVPQLAAYPNKRSMVGAGFMLAALLGVAIALLLEHLDHGFRSAEQLSDATGQSTLGLVPMVPKRWRRRVEDRIVDAPQSGYSEAVSSTLASLFLAAGERRPKLVLVTSTLPGEGKTTLSISLARAAAQSGLRVLLVDLDLRRPAVHQALGQELEPGVTDILSDRIGFADAVRQDPKSTVAVLPAGRAMASPLHALASERTRQFLHGLGKYYDLIVLDSSPVMAVADARILSRYVDRTVFVVRWASTRREQALNAIDQITEAGGRLGGTVLSMVNVRRHAQYSFGDSGAYHVAARYYKA